MYPNKAHHNRDKLPNEYPVFLLLWVLVLEVEHLELEVMPRRSPTDDVLERELDDGLFVVAADEIQ